MKPVFVVLIGILLCGLAAAAPAKVYQADDPGLFTIGGLKIGMTKAQAIAALGAPVKSMGDSLYFDQEKKSVSIATFRGDRLFQIFGNQVEYKGKPAKTTAQMQHLLGPASLVPDPKSAYWYVATPTARLVVVFSSEGGKPYCSLIDRTGKEF